MKKLGISKEKLLTEYNREIDEICDINEEKDTFTGQEVCGIVHGILVENKVKTKLSANKLHKLYSKKVESLHLSRGEWVENYGIPEIINMLYTILEENQ